MSRTHFIFIDWENVSEFDSSRIVGRDVRVFMILGAGQAYLPVDLALFLQEHPEQLRIIRTAVVGRNALDFVLACELGRVLAAHPEGSFHIVSKDKDFKSIVTHLRGEGRVIGHHRSFNEIPFLLSNDERLALLRRQLEDPEAERPANRLALENAIRRMFPGATDESLVSRILAHFIAEGVLAVTGSGQVNYPD